MRGEGGGNSEERLTSSLDDVLYDLHGHRVLAEKPDRPAFVHLVIEGLRCLYHLVEREPDGLIRDEGDILITSRRQRTILIPWVIFVVPVRVPLRIPDSGFGAGSRPRGQK